MRSLTALLSLATMLAGTPAHATTPHAATRQPEIRTSDVERFFQLYDRTHGKPTVAQLQSDYLERGTPGLQQFITSRIHSADKLAAAIKQAPAAYADARSCAQALPAVRQQLRGVFSRLTDIYPPTTLPPVTVVIGRNNTGGTTTADGVIIGLETICRANWMDADITARLVHLIAHEYAHVQQPAAQVDPPAGATLLFQSLLEGGAEFIGELISGQVSNVQLQDWTRGHECEIERRFLAQAGGTDISSWLYNGPGTAAKPGDLGYWVGYRIARAYYAQAHDPHKAVADILAINNDNAAAFLRNSGWTPVTDCQRAH
ncbi:MAG: DUF2268 domain-containing putative Zn-dependent protease [Rhodanobacter sp.]